MQRGMTITSRNLSAVLVLLLGLSPSALRFYMMDATKPFRKFLIQKREKHTLSQNPAFERGPLNTVLRARKHMLLMASTGSYDLYKVGGHNRSQLRTMRTRSNRPRQASNYLKSLRK